MGKQPQRRKHVPQRVCVACRTARPKRELVRVVRLVSPGDEGTVVVDETGKRSGRGAYVCRQQTCWEIALTRRQLERALKVAITAENVIQFREYAAGLPQILAESEKSENDDSGR